MTEKQSSRVDVFVTIKDQQMLPQQKISLSLDAIAVGTYRTVAHKPIFLELDKEKQELITEENGRVSANLVFQYIAGIRKKLRVWGEGSEKHVNEYDIYLPGEEQNLYVSAQAELSDAKVKISKLEKELGEKKEHVTRLEQDLQQEKIYHQQQKIELSEEKKEYLKDILKNGELMVGEGQTVTLETDVYIVGRDIVIEEGGQLIIEPGCILQFSTDGGIICRGKLMAVGTAQRRILFTAYDKRESNAFISSYGKTPPKWKNILFRGKNSNGSSLVYCIIEHGLGREMFDVKDEVKDEECFTTKSHGSSSNRNGGGVAILFADGIELKNVVVRKCGFAYPEYANYDFVRDTFTNGVFCNMGGGIFVYSGSPTFMNVTVENNVAYRGGGMYFCKSNPKISRSFINNNFCKDVAWDHGARYAGAAGAGIYLSDSKPIFNEVEISGNNVYNGKDAAVGGKKIDNLSGCSIVGNKEI